MDDIDLAAAEPAPSARSRAAGQGFAADPDRAFLYRVVSIHARAGSAPAESASRIAGILASAIVKGAKGAALVRLQGRLYGAKLLADALARAGEGDPEAPVTDYLADAGLVLTPEEEAAFAVPASSLDRLPLAAELFDAVAYFLRESSRQ